MVLWCDLLGSVIAGLFRDSVIARREGEIVGSADCNWNHIGGKISG